MSAFDKIGVTSFNISTPSFGGKNVSFIEVEPSIMSPTAAIVKGSVLFNFVGVGSGLVKLVFSSLLTTFDCPAKSRKTPQVIIKIIKFSRFVIVKISVGCDEKIGVSFACRIS